MQQSIPSRSHSPARAVRLVWVVTTGVWLAVGSAGAVPAQGAPRPRAVPIGRIPRAPLLRPKSAGAKSLALAPLVTSPPPVLKINFQGVDDTRYTPADPNISVGTNHVIQTTNDMIRITTKTGTLVQDIDASTFFPGHTTDFIFDPWTVYDHFNQRFVILYIAATPNFSSSWFAFAISKTPDPTQGWNFASIPSDYDNPAPGTTPALTNNWSDYEKVGFDNTNFYITSNQFDKTTNSFSYARIRVLNKNELYSGPPNAQYFDFIDPQHPTGGQAFTPQPCVTFGNPKKGYVVSENTPDASVTLFIITGTWPNPTNTPPTLTSGKVDFTPWNYPSPARQRGSAVTIDGSDGRLLNAVYRNGKIYTGHSVSVGAVQCGASVKGFDVSTLTKTVDELFGSSTEDAYFPVIMVDNNDNLVVVYNSSGPNAYAGIKFAGRKKADTAFGNSVTLKNGLGIYTQDRWGDYNGIALDPQTGDCWIYSMFAKSTAINDWGTWVGAVDGGGTPPPPPPPPPANSSNVVSSFANGKLTLTGDAKPNAVTVSLTGTTLTVTGKFGTKINNTALNGSGDSIVTYNGANGRIGVQVDLGDGNDSITFTGVSVGTATVKLGSGNDVCVVSLSNVTTLNVNGGLGVDTVVTTGSVIGTKKLTLVP